MQTETVDETYRRPGFSIPGYASAAARKGHELGLCRRWTPAEAKEQGRRAAAIRWSRERARKGA